MKSSSGYFITFEGPEGSGKTTQIGLLADALSQRGYEVVTTREPGGTALGDAIRTLLLNQYDTPPCPQAEALLFNAARAQLVQHVIRPALKQGKIVLCDRYADSTLAYQGYAHGQELTQLRSVIDFATGCLVPHLTIFLDIDPNDGLQRKQTSADAEWNRMEMQTLKFHRKVRQGYLRLADADPQRWVVIDATNDISVVCEQVARSVNALFSTVTPARP